MVRKLFEAISAHFRGTVREPQVEFAEMVERTLQSERDDLVAEVPTGTGKSLALLVPALLSGKRVIISTATKNLQEQYKKDVALLMKLFPEFKGKYVSFAKGKGNYACTLKMAETGIVVQGERDENPNVNWAPISASTCVGIGDCKLSYNCPYGKQVWRWQNSHVIIANHALVMTDRQALPTPEAYIFDEAHHVEDVAREAFSYSFSEDYFKGLVDANPLLQRSDEPKVFLQLVKEYFGCIKLRGIYQQVLPELPQKLGEELLQEAERLDRRIVNVVNKVFVDAVHAMITLNSGIEKEGFIPWARAENDKTVIGASPVAVAEQLAFRFSGVPTVQVSATMGDLDYHRKVTGVPRASAVRYPGVFDYRKNCLLYIPEQFPSPKEPEKWREASIQKYVGLLNCSQGNALLLFTSWEMLDYVHGALQGKVEYPMKKQEGHNRDELVEWMKATPGSVLLGVASFWEGIDIPGDSLQMVIIDKIPFVAPGNPVEDAIQKGMGGWKFREIPVASRKLQQGFGRLIRSVNDRGVVAILDPRLMTMGYGTDMLEKLPGLRTQKSAVVKGFFDHPDFHSEFAASKKGDLIEVKNGKLI